MTKIQNVVVAKTKHSSYSSAKKKRPFQKFHNKPHRQHVPPNTTQTNQFHTCITVLSRKGPSPFSSRPRPSVLWEQSLTKQSLLTLATGSEAGEVRALCAWLGAMPPDSWKEGTAGQTPSSGRLRTWGRREECRAKEWEQA